MSDVCLGSSPLDGQQRDAIHVAVIPMIASEMLRPGQRVGLVGTEAGPSSNVLGIVDPYLTDVVPKGGKFWMCLLPNTVTGMRHEWQHPAFTAAPQQTVDGSKAAAERWLRLQCEPLGCSFETLVDNDSDLVNGQWLVTHQNEDAREHWYSIEDEFWVQRRIYTGQDVSERHRGGFSCSC